jgi:hypothetical protein
VDDGEEMMRVRASQREQVTGLSSLLVLCTVYRKNGMLMESRNMRCGACSVHDGIAVGFFVGKYEEKKTPVKPRLTEDNIKRDLN